MIFRAVIKIRKINQTIVMLLQLIVIIIIGIILIEQWKGKREGIDVAKPLARELWFQRERERIIKKKWKKKKRQRGRRVKGKSKGVGDE